ncbi:MAG: DUF116 domain-containing protein [Chloroflexi bacterium]|nr:DUF116 domain-containing protein [Chloroflexota bacterium]MBU1748357.1 DUF116 domain-containing protein [Chloroflexota bacterium]
MDTIITYSLRDGREHSDQYYCDVAAFTDEVLAEASGRVGSVVTAFRSWLEQTGRETPRTSPEYVFEFLTLGVLWRVYASRAKGLAAVPRQALAGLARLRETSSVLKPAVDPLRGVLAALFLHPTAGRPAPDPAPTVAHLARLLGWLAAAGDFCQEVKRLQAWPGFLADQPPEQASATLAAVLDLAAWFEARSAAVLGRYTPHVERFLTETLPGYRWREDAVFCGRRRVEYHLNMVGTEILNRAFRPAFLATARQMVIVPPCMKARSDNECQARPTPHGARCAGCTPGCRVRELTQLGDTHGFAVLIVPDELAVFSSGRGEPVRGAAVGVVGVSCVLTNAPGGWETQALGVPAQGILLDYCGCSYHWHETGIPTAINVGQLRRVLAIDHDEQRRGGDA